MKRNSGVNRLIPSLDFNWELFYETGTNMVNFQKVFRIQHVQKVLFMHIRFVFSLPLGRDLQNIMRCDFC